MTRAPEMLAVGLVVAALAAFSGALLTSKPPPVPSIVVVGEPLLPPSAPVALRFTAAIPNATQRSAVAGVVRAGVKTAPIEAGTARVEGGEGGEGGGGVVVADVVVDGRVKAKVMPKIERTSSIRLTPKLMYQWPRAEVMMGRPDGSSLYPVDGQPSGRLPSSLLIVDKATGVPTKIEVSPQLAGASVDGRVLRIDRSGLRIEGPLEVDAGGDVFVTVFAAEKTIAGVDLLVDGVVVDTHNVELDTKADVQLRSKGAGKPGDVVVVHAGGVWPDDLGRYLTLRVRDPNEPLVAWIEGKAKEAGAPDGEELMAWLKKNPDDAVAARAMLQRLRPAKLRAPKLSSTVATEASSARAWLLAYTALAGACVVVVALLGVVRLRGSRRLQGLAGTLALAAILAGLGAVLVITSA